MIGGGGQVKFYPHKKGDGKRFSHAEMGYAESSHPLKRVSKDVPCLEPQDRVNIFKYQV